jgi:hypothetical protein
MSRVLGLTIVVSRLYGHLRIGERLVFSHHNFQLAASLGSDGTHPQIGFLGQHMNNCARTLPRKRRTQMGLLCAGVAVDLICNERNVSACNMAVTLV